MNFLEKLIWRWQGKRKLASTDLALKYTGIRKLGEIANPDDFFVLLDHIEDDHQVIRNAVAQALRQMIINTREPEQLQEFKASILENVEESTSLSKKLTLIEIAQALDLEFRTKMLADQIDDAQHDLQYAIIKTLEDTTDVEILDNVLNASDTSDLVLRRIALHTWYSGLASQELDDVLDYITPRLHYLVRAAYELQTDGEFLRRALSFADQRELPHPKAYPDFMIRYITELLGNWEFDPEAYRSLHAIMVPSYFTFSEQDQEGVRPYVML